MALSARNQLRGTVTSVEKGIITAKVVVKIGDNQITSVITKDAVEDLDIKEGDEVAVVIKATGVMIMK
ncbi:MAG TPA: TOBE domain-containing protein [Anaerolineae bacterium]|nr:TOBE domain-containing protein [Anaerolineae bacterium]